MAAQVARILLSEGSSLSARETLTALGAEGHTLEVCDPNRLCLGRFSRFVKAVHRCPSFSADPGGYLRFVRALCARGRFDVLYPSHEQAFLFSRFAGELNVAHALPPFAAIARVQSKVAYAQTLAELGLPAPPTELVRDAAALSSAVARFDGAWVKRAIGTASSGVFRVRSAAEVERACRALDEGDGWQDGVLVQAQAPGALERAQAVFARGTLVAFHACRQLESAAGGGDVRKESVDRPAVREHLVRLGAHLSWHGPLSVDYLWDGQASHIDCNPRLAEPGNALASGLNLPEQVVKVALGLPCAPAGSRAGVRTHMGLQALLKAAGEERPRAKLTGALRALARGSGPFAGSQESLTPSVDAVSRVPFLVVAGVLLLRPRAWEGLARGAVDSYSLSPAAARAIQSGAL